MRKLLSIAGVAVVGLALVTPVQGKSGGSVPSGRSGPSHPPSRGDRPYYSDRSHHDFNNVHHDFKDYRIQKSFYYGRNNHFWSEYRWWDGHGRYVYWSPANYSWYYWNNFFGCYVPVTVPVVPYLPF